MGGLVEVLAVHAKECSSPDCDACECGWSEEDGEFILDGAEHYYRHLADRVLAWVDARVGEAREVRERLRRPPCWGPNEQGDYMVDMTVDSYERDLDSLMTAVREALGLEGER